MKQLLIAYLRSTIRLLSIFSLVVVPHLSMEAALSSRELQLSSLRFIKHSIDQGFDIPTTISGVDLDGDGDIDIIGSAYNGKEIAWWENLGRQIFRKHTVDDAFAGLEVSALDIDLDGDLDLLGYQWDVTENAQEIAWWENDGHENFNKRIIDDAFIAWDIQTSDFNGDGFVDLIAADYRNSELAWWESIDGRMFIKHTLDNGFEEGSSIGANDFDGDGDIDVIGASQGQVAGNQDDFDNDGYLDGLVTTPSCIAWWEIRLNTVHNKHILECGLNTASVVVSNDVDGDGDYDVLGLAYYSNEISWWKNEGNNKFTKHVIDDNFKGPQSVYAIDLDNDGDKDVIGSASMKDGVAWWENDSKLNFEKHTIDGSFWGAAMYPIDLDGDGDVDILGGDFRTGEIVWWEQVGVDETSSIVFLKDGDIWMMPAVLPPGQPVTSSGVYIDFSVSPAGNSILGLTESGDIHLIGLTHISDINLGKICYPSQYRTWELDSSWAPDGAKLLVQYCEGTETYGEPSRASVISSEGEVISTFDYGFGLFPSWGAGSREIHYFELDEFYNNIESLRTVDISTGVDSLTSADLGTGEYEWLGEIQPNTPSNWMAIYTDEGRQDGCVGYYSYRLSFLSDTGQLIRYPFTELCQDGECRQEGYLNIDWDPSGDWSSSGNRYAFFVQEDLTYQRRYPALVVYDVETNQRNVLWANGGLNPRWSPDGDLISITTPGGGLTVIDATTGQAKELLPDAARENLVEYLDSCVDQSVGFMAPREMESSWSPDGDYLLFNYLTGFYIVDSLNGATQWIAAGQSPKWVSASKFAEEATSTNELEVLIAQKRDLVNSLDKATISLFLDTLEINVDGYDESTALNLLSTIEKGQELTDKEIEAYKRHILHEKTLQTLLSHQLNASENMAQNVVDMFGLYWSFAGLLTHSAPTSLEEPLLRLSSEYVEAWLQHSDSAFVRDVAKDAFSVLADTYLANEAGDYLDLAGILLGETVKGHMTGVYLNRYISLVQPTLDKSARSVLHEDPTWWDVTGSKNAAEVYSNHIVDTAEHIYTITNDLINDIEQGSEVNDIIMETADMVTIYSKGSLSIADTISAASRVFDAWLITWSGAIADRAYSCINSLSVAAGETIYEADTQFLQCKEFEDLDALPPYLEAIFNSQLWLNIQNSYPRFRDQSTNLLDALIIGTQEEIQRQYIDVRTTYELLLPQIDALQSILLNPPRDSQVNYLIPGHSHVSMSIRNSLANDSRSSIINAFGINDYKGTQAAFSSYLDLVMRDLLDMKIQMGLIEAIAEAAISDEPTGPLAPILEQRIERFNQASKSIERNVRSISLGTHPLRSPIVVLLGSPARVQVNTRDQIELALQVKNYGTEISSDIKFTAILNGEQVASSILHQLNPGEVSSIELSILSPQPGTYILYLNLDDGERAQTSIVIVEVDENVQYRVKELISILTTRIDYLLISVGALLLLIGVLGSYVISKRRDKLTS